MLEELLRLVAEGGTCSYEDVLKRLPISQAMLEAMLGDLGRLGYLRSVANGCEGGCQACPMAGCSVGGPGRVWMLTHRGAKAAARLLS